jgi:hypothetical protein
MVELAEALDALRASPAVVEGPRTALALEVAARMLRQQAARLDERRAHGADTE